MSAPLHYLLVIAEQAPSSGHFDSGVEKRLVNGGPDYEGSLNTLREKIGTEFLGELTLSKAFPLSLIL